MVRIASPQLSISHARPGHPGRRQIRIAYDLVTEPGDALAGRELQEVIALVAVDAHDAAVAPTPAPVVYLAGTVTARDGSHRRVIERELDRVDLDVVADWWATNNEGEPVAIAEWLDHLAGSIVLQLDGVVLDEARTPVVTGSWGALGSD